ncbi:elongation factor P lysine(34) lysyltransferase [Zobellella denitrificans]|uniref:Elongation factor P--(R)-beta-lysine ligase n=2 Tax=Zobellella denitrificans TaxID=347534 RepID=A0A231MXF8_9GAMM|nr:elongation factor P--(R)-beta-lysine ligase [Zobellella denitrificans]ATG75786.1 poxB regulator PoxA [Zobellella denitrificans]OXS14730.1 elongation factor P lysine(34) lysyltransferase [Zobellella denitrificans]
MTTIPWPPTASLAFLQQRARLLAAIRHFFAERQVLEVDTPTLASAGVTDVHLDNFVTRFVGPGMAQGLDLYLQTSPEFHMKRLLAAGSGPIYQICKAYRNEESGRLHNPEFTMLEWYRPGFDHHQLMDEMAGLLQLVLGCDSPERLTYQQAFTTTLGVCPLSASLDELRRAGQDLGADDLIAREEDRDTLLQLLFALGVEPRIGQVVPCFVYHFPASQAALARISPQDPRVAERFEVYFKGIELANGFHELSDADEQRRRFEQDNRLRRGRGLPERPVDEYLLAALQAGLPDCAGVALGVDRLIMLALGAGRLEQVIAFPVTRA